MLRSISRKLAIDSLLREKKNTFFVLGVAVIAVATICLTTIAFSTYREIEKQENIEKLGSWHYMVENCDGQLETQIKKHQDTKEVAKVSIVGHVSYQDDTIMIASLQGVEKVTNYGIEVGTYPKEKEVAMTKKALAMLGYNDQLGQTITLTYMDMDGNTVTEDRILSGIVGGDVLDLLVTPVYDRPVLLSDMLNPTSEIVEYALPAIFMSDTPVANRYRLFVELKSKDMTLKSSILKEEDLQLADNLVYTIRNTLDEPYNLIFNSAYNVSAASNVFINMFQFMVYAIALVITFTVVLGTTLSSLKIKEKEYALLRGIGQTKQQLKMMLLYQTLYICLLAIPMGLLVTAICTFVGNLLFENITGIHALTYYPKEIVYSVLAVIVILYFATFIPASKASKKALSGTFDEEEFHRIQIRYRKLKKQNPRRLAFRELVTSRTGTIIMILLLAFTFVSVTNVLDYRELEQSYQKVLEKAKEDKKVSFVVNEEVGDMASGISQEEVDVLQTIYPKIGYTRQCKVGSMMEVYWPGIEKEDKLFYNVGFGGTKEYYYSGIAKNVIMSSHLDNAYMQETFLQSLQGRLPEKENEVVVYLPYLNYQNRESWSFYGEVSARSKEDGDYNGHIDTITLGTKIDVKYGYSESEVENDTRIESYTVVGVVQEIGQTYWMPTGTITMMFTDDKFHEVYGKIMRSMENTAKPTTPISYSSIFASGMSKEQKEKLIVYLEAVQEANPDMQILDEEVEVKAVLETYQEEYYKNTIKATAISLVSFFLYYYISRFKILYTINHIGLLKSVGASDKQIYQVVLWKMGYCSIVALLLSQWTVIYGVMMRPPVPYYQYPYVSHILVTILLIVISLGVYCLPLRKILKKDIMENIAQRE